MLGVERAVYRSAYHHQHVENGRGILPQPDDAFAIFRYKGDWYWIDHDDLVSKRVFLLILFLTTLTNRVTDEKVPVLTIPTS